LKYRLLPHQWLSLSSHLLSPLVLPPHRLVSLASGKSPILSFLARSRWLRRIPRIFLRFCPDFPHFKWRNLSILPKFHFGVPIYSGPPHDLKITFPRGVFGTLLLCKCVRESVPVRLPCSATSADQAQAPDASVKYFGVPKYSGLLKLIDFLIGSNLIRPIFKFELFWRLASWS